MSTIITKASRNIAILRLNNGVINGISYQLVEDLTKAVNLVKQDADGIILAGGKNFFCIGLDLPSLLKLSRAEITNFIYKFNKITFDIFKLLMPTVCILSGHAIAGGNILALSCDYRLADSNNKKIGLNEVKLGLPVPYLPDLILRQIVRDKIASDIIYTGEFITFDKANKIRLIDKIYLPEELENAAIEKIEKLAKLYKPAFAAVKENRIEEICNRYEKNYKIKEEIFIDCWFNKDVQKLLEKAAEKF